MLPRRRRTGKPSSPSRAIQSHDQESEGEDPYRGDACQGLSFHHPHHRYDHDLHDGGYGAVNCVGAPPDRHFPHHGRQGCTLAQRQSCVDHQGPQCHAVVQWYQARRRGPVCCWRRQYEHHRQGEERRPVTANAARAWQYHVLVLEGRMAVHVLAGRVGFCRLSSNSRHRCCEGRTAHPPWRGGPDDHHDAPATRGHKAHLSGPQRARHRVQGGERVQVQMCMRRGRRLGGQWGSGSAVWLVQMGWRRLRWYDLLHQMG